MRLSNPFVFNPHLPAGRCLAGLLLALGGCAHPGAFDDAATGVASSAARHLAQPVPRADADPSAAASRVRELLSRPLSSDDAVQVALLNHRGLQAHWAALGQAQADLVQATRPANPSLTLGAARRGHARESRVGAEFPLGQWLTLPLAAPLAQAQFEQAQRGMLREVLTLARATRKAHIEAVAATQAAAYQAQVQEVADTAAELARRMKAAGNWSRLAEAREQAFAAESAMALAASRQARQQALERLARCLGLEDGPRAFTLPEQLPALPDALPEPAELEQLAMSQRLDLRAARSEAEAAAQRLGLTRRTRFIDVLTLGAERIGSNEEANEHGIEVRFELPLFDWGESRVSRAEAQYMQAVHRAAEAAVNARSQVREAQAAARHRFEVAQRFRDEIVPLRKRIADEQLLRYNGMLISVFELLADARAQIDAVRGSIEATRDHWLAQADLEAALTGETPAP